VAGDDASAVNQPCNQAVLWPAEMGNCLRWASVTLRKSDACGSASGRVTHTLRAKHSFLPPNPKTSRAGVLCRLQPLGKALQPCFLPCPWTAQPLPSCLSPTCPGQVQPHKNPLLLLPFAAVRPLRPAPRAAVSGCEHPVPCQHAGLAQECLCWRKGSLSHAPAPERCRSCWLARGSRCCSVQVSVPLQYFINLGWEYLF